MPGSVSRRTSSRDSPTYKGISRVRSSPPLSGWPAARRASIGRQELAQPIERINLRCGENRIALAPHQGERILAVGCDPDRRVGFLDGLRHHLDIFELVEAAGVGATLLRP